MRSELFRELKAIDDFISDINQRLDYTKYLNPLNLREENSKFLDSYRKGRPYNPEYVYQPYEDIDFEVLRKQISSVRLSNSPMEEIFKRYLVFLDNLVSFYQNRGITANFTKYSIKAFGLPDGKLIEEAYTFLTTTKSESTEIRNIKQYDAHDLATKLQDRIDQHGFDWKITVLDSSTTKVTVDPEDRVIYLNGSMEYSENSLERLKVHEIDTHVLRSENGRIQPFKIFSTGLANSLSTEEGLAVVSEERNDVLDKNTLRLYAGRVIGVSLAMKRSFYETFAELIRYFNEEDALYITQRVKKGLCDTSKHGGFTKDYAYFDGYYKVKEFLGANDDAGVLFVGSIGLDDVSDVKKLLKMNAIHEPKTIPSTYRGRG